MTDKELRKMRLELLNETIQAFNSTNRCVDTKGDCIYSATETSQGCAIGRLLPKELCNQFDHIESDTDALTLFDEFPENIQIYGKRFLYDLQSLHDQECNWDSEGLNDTGLQMVERIKKDFKL